MKRIIFVLLHSHGHFMLSRNFRLQRVGDINWLLRNYEIRRVSQGIDELIILDVSAPESNRDLFYSDVARVVEECFIPVAVGGNLRTLQDIDECFAAGSDKIVLNRAFFEFPALCIDAATKYGSQAVIAGIDVADESFSTQLKINRHAVARDSLAEHVRAVSALGAGELLIQSIARDGTGSGVDLSLVQSSASGSTPLILMGGVGQPEHISQALLHEGVDAVATANLFNFIGSTLVEARDLAIAAGVPLGRASAIDLEDMRGILGSMRLNQGHGPSARSM